ncbi:ULP PROTEASE domain-containing protein [Aphis craccivora]|uniref:ULP PROTEASE domain-containing protein n=1 Tax=Aphis craccivora TaxID=307492 RepID=A0A6G0VM76_APHCR|nr:ULP PROTEASE domain-containing protein [Aphis craccivora]
MSNNIDMEQCGGTNRTSKLSPLVESNNMIEVPFNKKKICGRVPTFLLVPVSESNFKKSLEAGDRVVYITQHSLLNISCVLNKLGFDDNDEHLTVNNSGNNPYDVENITVLNNNSCTKESHKIVSTSKKTNSDMASNEIPKKDSKTSKCTAIKQTDESFKRDCGVSKLDGTLDTLNNSFLRSGEIKMIEEEKKLFVDICRQQTFTHSPLAVDFKYNKSHVDGDCSPMKSIMLPNEVEADAKALLRNFKNIFPLTIRGDLEKNKEKRYNFSYLNTIEGFFELSICDGINLKSCLMEMIECRKTIEIC